MCSGQGSNTIMYSLYNYNENTIKSVGDFVAVPKTHKKLHRYLIERICHVMSLNIEISTRRRVIVFGDCILKLRIYK